MNLILLTQSDGRPLAAIIPELVDSFVSVNSSTTEVVTPGGRILVPLSLENVLEQIRLQLSYCYSVLPLTPAEKELQLRLADLILTDEVMKTMPVIQQVLAARVLGQAASAVTRMSEWKGEK